MSAVHLTPDMAIGDAARLWPHLLPLFERYGLDYCCHGRRTLDESCRAVGVNVAQVLHDCQSIDTTAADTEPDPSAASMTSLCDHIEATHHVRARETFARLRTLMPRILAAHGAAHPELFDLDRVISELREEMIDHMVREERVLFPWLRRLEQHTAVHVGPPWSVKRPIDCMLHDHDAVSAALGRIRMLTRGYQPPAGTCASVQSLMDLLRDLERDTHVHIHKENNILFPAGVRAEAERRATGCRWGARCSCATPEETQA